MAFSPDLRFSINDRFEGEAEAESSLRDTAALDSDRDSTPHHSDHASSEEDKERGEEKDGFVEGMDPDGFAGPKIMKPLTPEALAAYQAAQNKTGVIYISRIPPGMRPTKVRHIMSQYGEVGRVYLQQEDAKRAYLRRKYTLTKKVHYTEGWVEFKDKKIARSVAEMLNAQPIGGKKGTRWRDDIWTMKYLPKFKWHMLTEQVAHEAAIRTARLRLELSQSRTEQRDYLKNVELARVLKKRAERKRAAGKEMPARAAPTRNEKREADVDFEQSAQKRKKRAEPHEDGRQLDSVLKSIF